MKTIIYLRSLKALTLTLTLFLFDVSAVAQRGNPNSRTDTYQTANGARANLRFGTRDYLIQQNWLTRAKDTAVFLIRETRNPVKELASLISLSMRSVLT